MQEQVHVVKQAVVKMEDVGMRKRKRKSDYDNTNEESNGKKY